MSDIEPISQQVPYMIKYANSWNINLQKKKKNLDNMNMISVGNHEHDYSDPEKLDPATGMKPFHPEGIYIFF